MYHLESETELTSYGRSADQEFKKSKGTHLQNQKHLTEAKSGLSQLMMGRMLCLIRFAPIS